MSKYFSRERCLQEIKAYIERAETHMENDGYYEAQFEGFEELQDDLFNLETIDIVRCGECKYCVDAGAQKALVCDNSYIDMDIHPDDFCSYGERKVSEKPTGSEKPNNSTERSSE